MFMMTSNAWNSLRDQLYGKFSSGAEVILFDMGKSYGSELVSALRESLMKAGKNPLTGLDPRNLSQLVTSTGWGRVHLSGDLEAGSYLSVVVSNCVFCAGEQSLAHHCPFLRGISVGIASNFYKAEYEISANCVIEKYHHFCKFELSQKQNHS